MSYREEWGVVAYSETIHSALYLLNIFILPSISCNGGKTVFKKSCFLAYSAMLDFWAGHGEERGTWDKYILSLYRESSICGIYSLIVVVVVKPC